MAKRKYDPLWVNITAEAASEMFAVLQETNERLKAENAQKDEALRGVALMLNTALKAYSDEPWALRVRAALNGE